jgi:hypothetical protein
VRTEADDHVGEDLDDDEDDGAGDAGDHPGCESLDLEPMLRLWNIFAKKYWRFYLRTFLKLPIMLTFSQFFL